MAAKIKIYTLSTCSHCKATKKFLNDNSLPFDCVDVDLLQGNAGRSYAVQSRPFFPDHSDW